MLFIFSRRILEIQKIPPEYAKGMFNVSGIYHYDIMKIAVGYHADILEIF